ncbi:class I SAM-dependent methyltransferase [Rhodococcus sp. H36-A4]|uniref:O-methyltransferase n=1 Tax=Rhodococcus sp. H36-A4 TaxID=3004353 RepID=UPI0022AF2010|nr:class I SAM-dependent methyltransferase [Rhodococcus sp. H36-A4]MCZ4076801.1 class I SAM-dependent methyltransferase [Rhodococcus sp. H36-A4]
MSDIDSRTEPRPVTPSSILAAELREVTELLAEVASIPDELMSRITRLRDLAAGLDPYLELCTTEESPALAALSHRTRTADWASRPVEQEMLSGQVEGQLLKFLVHMTRARRVLEIGMFTGYSALAMAEALPPNGEVVACEVDEYVADFARKSFAESAAGARIVVEVGPASETLRRLNGTSHPFDLVFVDADKTGYLDYYRMLLDSDLLTADTVIVVDNTLMQGHPYAPADRRTGNGDAIADFNRYVAGDPRVEQVLLPLRDGVTLVRRISA